MIRRRHVRRMPMRERVASRLVTLRWLVIAVWATIVLLTFTVPPPEPEADLEGFAAGNPAVEAELRSFELFGFPLVSRVALVQHDTDGLSVLAQVEAVLRAAALSQGSYDTEILGALPVPNTFGVFPGSRESGTTVLTYLFTDPRSSFAEQRRAAEAFAHRHLSDPDDAFAGVTGSVPARDAQAEILMAAFHRVELATVLAIVLIVALAFRSAVAPVVPLITAGTAVLVTLWVAGWAGAFMGIAVPPDLRPLIVALLLGVVTDYCILFMSGMRHRLHTGETRRAAARHAIADFTPIVAVAGVTVAAGTAVLVVARSPLFRGFGPGMALTVLVGLVVSLTLVPALLSVLRGWLFRGRRPYAAPAREQGSTESVPATLSARLVTERASALAVAAGCVLLLAMASLPLLRIDLGLSFVQSLPSEEPVARAAAAAHQGFAPGILSPTELLLEGPGLGREPAALKRLGDALEQQPGVAGVLGPGDLPFPDPFGVLVTRSGDAVRYLLVLDSAPLGADAINALSQIQEQLPALLARAGLEPRATAYGGDTALSAHVVDRTTDDLVRISLAALAVNLLMLVLFLRSLIAPLLLLASSVLALCASLGLTVLLFQGLLAHDGLTFYVPFAAAVLLVALGSDYNIFAVGHIWHLTAQLPLREAIRAALPQSTRAITSAGLALAVSFGLLAMVPLTPFRELGFVMGIGILLDVFVVRTLLVPSLLTIVGPRCAWPSRLLTERAELKPDCQAAEHRQTASCGHGFHKRPRHLKETP